MRHKNFSIITDFGCPFKCSFCITDSQNTKKDFEFSQRTIQDIKSVLLDGRYTRLSISGGGEPLFFHNPDIRLFFESIISFCKARGIEIHVHTNIDKPISQEFLSSFDKVVVSINHDNYQDKMAAWSVLPSVRYVHVSNGCDIIMVSRMASNLPTGHQLTVKQLDGTPDSDMEHLKLAMVPLKGALFLPSGDYNTYYSLRDNRVYDRFKDIKFA